MKQSYAVAIFFVVANAIECNATSTPVASCLELHCASNSVNGVNGDEVSMLQISKSAASERNLRILQNSVPQKVAGYTTFNLSFEGDCFGNNMQVIESTTTSACASACDSKDDCAGFSFGMSTRCVLKGKSCTKEQAVDDGWQFYKKGASTTPTTTIITTPAPAPTPAHTRLTTVCKCSGSKAPTCIVKDFVGGEGLNGNSDTGCAGNDNNGFCCPSGQGLCNQQCVEPTHWRTTKCKCSANKATACTVKDFVGGEGLNGNSDAGCAGNDNNGFCCPSGQGLCNQQCE